MGHPAQSASPETDQALRVRLDEGLDEGPSPPRYRLAARSDRRFAISLTTTSAATRITFSLELPAKPS